eukprot:TRINITY_DN1813_c0_g2_i1.p1 TRINITY_DN1813_c0_g2~~TRINITY_DN1813_c0_g2_i1.p1  ORF type:complete len:124 (-),score=8.41 TRINITY_DN1813_c0_g2_i1:173-514(-)
MSCTTFSPLAMSRAVRNKCAPVACRARAVSTPIPAEHPVMKMTLSVSLPTSPSSLMMSIAVGRASPGPLGLTCAAAYLDDIAFNETRRSKLSKFWIEYVEKGNTPPLLLHSVA